MTTGSDGRLVIAIDELPGGENASTFVGRDHGAQVSFFLSHNRPGTGRSSSPIGIHLVARMETEWLE